MKAHVVRIVVAVQLAAAAGYASPDDPAEARALAHLDRGVAAYRAGDFARARAELTAASELAPDRPNPYRWLALADSALGDCDAALVHVESFLSRVAAGDPRVAEIIAIRQRCLSSGRVTVTSTPSGAAIRIDGGAPAATTPVHRLALPLGRHRISVEKPGFVTETHDFDVAASGELWQRFDLQPEPARTSVLRRWWFWAAVGAVAVTAGGITYGLTRGSSPSRLPPVTCDATGCHP